MRTSTLGSKNAGQQPFQLIDAAPLRIGTAALIGKCRLGRLHLLG